MVHGNTLIDNSENLKLVDIIKYILSDQNISQVDIATGYWDVPGVALLADELDGFLERDGTALRILIGKDPYLFAKYNANPKYKDSTFPEDFIRTDINEIEVKAEYEKAVSLLLKYLERKDKIEIRIFRKGTGEDAQFLHSKCYVFMNAKEEQACGIIGSSNFTQKGLEGNAELNYLETQWLCVGAQGSSKHKTHEGWFNEKWETSEDWTREFLEEVLKKSPIGKAAAEKTRDATMRPVLTPYESYIKLLQDKFGMINDAAMGDILKSYLPDDIRPLEYQLNAVKQCYASMLQHGGFALGDVVGLGKTIVALLLVKYYIEDADRHERGGKVLVITPPAVRSLWIETIDKFDKNQTDKLAEHVDFITMGSLAQLVEEDFDISEEDVSDAEDFERGLWDAEDDAAQSEKENVSAQAAKEADGGLKELGGNAPDYGLVIIDESHRFRNSDTQMYEALAAYLENVNAKNGWYPYVGLLSATIQNNSPRDIKNQIYLFEHEPKNSSFEKVPARNLDRFFSEAITKYDELIHTKTRALGIDAVEFAGGNDADRKRKLIDLSKEIRENVLGDILVRRTRTDIKNHYRGEFSFPAVHEPENLFYLMDKKLAALFYDTMNIIAPKTKEGGLIDEAGLGYYRYRATMFLNAAYEKRYEGRNMTARRASNQLARIMQILLVKRLESSFEAFKESLRNFARYTQNMITMWERDAIFICPQIDVNKELNVKEKQEKFPDKAITLETCFDDIREKINRLTKEGRNEKNQNAEYRRADFRAASGQEKSYIDYLKDDMEKINRLVERWNENDYDPKMDRFKIALYENESTGFFSKERNPPHKLVIFSEAIATVNALSRAVENITKKAPLVVTAKNREGMEKIIKENFDANCEKSAQKNDYDVIITTETLAEGINLHRANSILNYDTPWNATRLIQRIGRVNRIGSENSDIYVYNFYPSAQGDEEINLVRNAYTKLQSFHTMFGEDNKIFSAEEELSEGNFEALVDGGESPQEKYIAELKRYRERNPARYEFIARLDGAGEQSREPNASGAGFFAIKTKGDAGCVYVRVAENGADIISYAEMFDTCRPPADAATSGPPKNAAALKERAISEYHRYEKKLFTAKKIPPYATRVIEKIVAAINSGTYGEESMHLLGNAKMAIQNGNAALAKRLAALFAEIENAQNALIPMSAEELNAMLQKALRAFSDARAKAAGEAYIFAGFYF